MIFLTGSVVPCQGFQDGHQFPVIGFSPLRAIAFWTASGLDRRIVRAFVSRFA